MLYEKFNFIQSSFDIFFLLQRLLHPSFQASIAKAGFAFVEDLVKSCSGIGR